MPTRWPRPGASTRRSKCSTCCRTPTQRRRSTIAATRRARWAGAPRGSPITANRSRQGADRLCLRAGQGLALRRGAPSARPAAEPQHSGGAQLSRLRGAQDGPGRRGDRLLPQIDRDKALTDYAYALAKAWRFDEALQVLDLLQNPNTAEALNYRGYAARKMGRGAEGIAYYRKSIATRR